jgi:hypothetical protein
MGPNRNGHQPKYHIDDQYRAEYYGAKFDMSVEQILPPYRAGGHIVMQSCVALVVALSVVLLSVDGCLKSASAQSLVPVPFPADGPAEVTLATLIGASMEPTLAGPRHAFACGACGLQAYFAGPPYGNCPRCNGSLDRVRGDAFGGDAFGGVAQRTRYAFRPLDVKSIDQARAELARGDIVVFQDADGAQAVKRLIAFPGETIAFRHGSIVIDGKVWERGSIFFQSATLLGVWECRLHRALDGVSERELRPIVEPIFQPMPAELRPVLESSPTFLFANRSHWPVMPSQAFAEPESVGAIDRFGTSSQVTRESWFNPQERVSVGEAHGLGVLVEVVDPLTGLLWMDVWTDPGVVSICLDFRAESDSVGSFSVGERTSKIRIQVRGRTIGVGVVDRVLVVGTPDEVRSIRLPAVAGQTKALETEPIIGSPMNASSGPSPENPIRFRIEQSDSLDAAIKNKSVTDLERTGRFRVSVLRPVQYGWANSANADFQLACPGFFVVGDNVAISADSRQEPELVVAADQILGVWESVKNLKFAVESQMPPSLDRVAK